MSTQFRERINISIYFIKVHMHYCTYRVIFLCMYTGLFIHISCDLRCELGATLLCMYFIVNVQHKQLILYIPFRIHFSFNR